MKRFDWEGLNSRQLGRYAEYFVKMELTMHGLDIYTSEVDDKGIDFVARKGANRYWDVQVKSVYKSKYIYFAKSAFDIEQPNLLVAVIPFVDGEAPIIYLIPAQSWKAPNSLLVSRDYEGKVSAPEWGLQLSRKNMVLLSPYAFELIVSAL
jgi:hypothetical protein